MRKMLNHPWSMAAGMRVLWQLRILELVTFQRFLDIKSRKEKKAEDFQGHQEISVQLVYSRQFFAADVAVLGDVCQRRLK